MTAVTFLVFAALLLIILVPVILGVGFYFGRQAEQQRKELQVQYERQVRSLQTTIKRLLQRLDRMTGERVRLQQANEDLRRSASAQQQASLLAGADLEHQRERAQELEEALGDLSRHNERTLGRLEQAEKQNKQIANQLQQTIEHFTEVGRLRQNVVFATNELRDSQFANQALKSRLSQRLTVQQSQEEPDTVPAAALDVEVIDGLETEDAQKLHDSGIHTIGDLAGQTPARVAHFVGQPDWEKSAEWIAEAQARLSPANGGGLQA